MEKKTPREAIFPIAPRLKDLMRLRGFTMVTLAEAIGVTQQTINNLTAGHTTDPAFSIIYKLSKCLHVDIKFFTGEDNRIDYIDKHEN